MNEKNITSSLPSPSGQRSPLKYKFKYLGMKWRFLKFDLEKESLPPVPRGDQVALENQAILERSVIFETYEKGLNLPESTYPSLVNGNSLIEDSFTSLNQFPASELDSVFTEEDVMRGIRNVQIFQSVQPIQTIPPSTGQHQQLGPSKPMVFSPRPPEECKPSTNLSISSRINQINNKRSPRKLRNQNMKKSSTLQEQIHKLEIGKSFKMYAIEKGIRIPDCVKTVNIDNCFDGVVPTQASPFPSPMVTSLPANSSIKEFQNHDNSNLSQN